MIKTTHEIHGASIHVLEKANTIWLQAHETQAHIIYNIALVRDDAVKVRRSLARLTGLSGDNPTGSSWSIAELSRLRKEISQQSDLGEYVPDVLDVLNNFIDLIEASNGDGDGQGA